jgi:hypothetical protein
MSVKIFEKKLTEKQKQLFEDLPSSAFAGDLQQLLYYEAEGFGEWTVSQLISEILTQVEGKRFKQYSEELKKQ